MPLVAAAAAAAALWAFRGELASVGSSLSLESPETQVRGALAHQNRAHLEDVYGFGAGGTLELVPVRYTDVVPVVEGNRATVVAMLDAEGRVKWRERIAEVSYLGRERFHMKPCSIALWCGEGDQFAQLRGVLRALFRRLDAVEGRDPAAYAALVADDYADAGLDRRALLERLRAELAASPRSERVLRWQIRVDRDGAEVGEDREVEEANGSRPARARYRLVRRGERWLFAAGL
ncbi:MAG TPA: nuclear transport factor 2 family protein [Anaeromyxobacteraceae bacterium]|nr:nuclear transport factor 2 family protein [Anaeromyxobacteraceae bacterium]